MSELDARAPLLRTLAPMLRGLETQLRGWIDIRRRYPLTAAQRSELEGLADDLLRKAGALDVEQPLLVVMLMGGTGVGKSTLMNALAGAAVAQSSFIRPTTRDPVVYFHNTLKPERLDPALRLCRFVQHDREGLVQKVIVDTPDVDSNDLANREKLKELLPVADVVLMVGSQEKYHDRIAWDLFKEQRQRRAFAFVLNKWDRCQDAGAGLRPDADWLRDLHAEGYASPKLFRTVAQAWVDAAAAGREVPEQLPEGEQFAELVAWLEAGLNRLEIESVKVRGVGQLIAQVERVLEGIKPPDFSTVSARVRTAWQGILDVEAAEQATVLLGTLEPYQDEVEHHFRVQNQANYWGLTAGYFQLVTKATYFAASLRDRIPFAPKGPGKVSTPDAWDVAEFVRSCSRTAGERGLTQRLAALANKLLVEADRKGFPMPLLAERAAEAGRLDWDDRTARSLAESLQQVEREVTKPTGWRRWLRGGLTLLANVLPPVVLLGSIALLLYRFFVEGITPTLVVALLPVYTTLATLVFVQVLVALLLPVRWSAIRERFRSRIEATLLADFEGVFRGIPDETSAAIRDEKRQVEALIAETKQVADWLKEREEATRAGELYGS